MDIGKCDLHADQNYMKPSQNVKLKTDDFEVDLLLV